MPPGVPRNKRGLTDIASYDIDILCFAAIYTGNKVKACRPAYARLPQRGESMDKKYVTPEMEIVPINDDVIMASPAEETPSECCSGIEMVDTPK